MGRVGNELLNAQIVIRNVMNLHKKAHQERKTLTLIAMSQIYETAVGVVAPEAVVVDRRIFRGSSLLLPAHPSSTNLRFDYGAGGRTGARRTRQEIR